MSTKTYTGQRRPRGDDPEQWALYYEKHPEKIEEAPKTTKRERKKKEIITNIPEPTPIPVVKKRTIKDDNNSVWSHGDSGKLTARDKAFMKKLEGLIAWSPLLAGSLIIKSVDTDRNIINVMIHKQASLTFDELLALDSEHFSTVNQHGKPYKVYLDRLEAINIEAFRQFNDWLSKDKKISLKDWLEEGTY